MVTQTRAFNALARRSSIGRTVAARNPAVIPVFFGELVEIAHRVTRIGRGHFNLSTSGTRKFRSIMLSALSFFNTGALCLHVIPLSIQNRTTSASDFIVPVLNASSSSASNSRTLFGRITSRAKSPRRGECSRGRYRNSLRRQCRHYPTRPGETCEFPMGAGYQISGHRCCCVS